MALVDELNRVSYVAEDFATYRSEADSFYKNNYPADFNDLIATNLGNALMDQLAFAMQSLSFMVNRRASELFLDTARLNRSITKLARMLGYTISPASPSTADLTITFTGAPFLVPISIPSGFQFQGPGDIVYEYANENPAVLLAGQTTLTIPVREGRSKTVTFVSDGTENQQFSLLGIPAGQYLYSDSFTVGVDGTTWTRLNQIKYESSNIYEVLFTDVPPKLRFGDNIAGNIPATSSSIVVKFRYGFGLAGSVGSNQIVSPVTPLVVNGVTIDMSFSNPASVVGADPEDIRHVRAYASSFFRTQNAAVIKDDYDSIAQLRSGVALADAQIMRGISNDITIQAAFSEISAGEVLLNSAVSGIATSSVSGASALGVSGTSSLYVGGISGLGVSGQSFLGVSGTQFLGADISGNVTGISYLGVSGISGLQVIGQSGLIIGGTSSLGVSGQGSLGVQNSTNFVTQAASGVSMIEYAKSSLSGYLSVAFSDTSKANNVQVVVLGVDVNNKYITPPSAVLTDVQTTLQGLADAVVTVAAVDGSSRIVNADVRVQIGISQTAIKTDVESLSLNALVGTSYPYGILVRRSPGVSLYRSEIQDAIKAANATGDIVFVNVDILSPSALVDSEGNLIIEPQQVVQNGNVSVAAVGRFVGKNLIPF
jgi:hypothetical protein